MTKFLGVSDHKDKELIELNEVYVKVSEAGGQLTQAALQNRIRAPW